MAEVKNNTEVQVENTQANQNTVNKSQVPVQRPANILQQADAHKSVGTKMVFTKEPEKKKPETKEKE